MSHSPLLVELLELRNEPPDTCPQEGGLDSVDVLTGLPLHDEELFVRRIALSRFAVRVFRI